METLFYLISALMLLVAVGALAFPILNHRPPADADRQRQNIDAAKERLKRLREESLSPEEADARRADIERLLLDDTATATADNRPDNRQSKWPAVVFALFVPLLAVSLYHLWGTPQALKASPANPLSQETLLGAVANLQAKLAQSPDNADEWLLLAKSLLTLERYSEAADAFTRYRALAGDSVTALLGEAEARTAIKQFDGAVTDLLDRALALEPNNGAALWLAGVQARQRGDTDATIAYWQRAAETLAGLPDEQARLLALIEQTRADASAAQSTATRIVVHIALAENYQSTVNDELPLFVFARAIDGAPIPLAAVRLTAGDLPATVILGDGNAMTPDRPLSAVSEATIIARISQSGQARATAGDLYAQQSPVPLGATITLTINTRLGDE